MRKDWELQGVVNAYCAVNGSPAGIFGDRWRYWLSNPIVWGAAQHLININTDRNVTRTFDATAVYKALASPRRPASSAEAWYKQTIATKPLANLAVLDLGCGEAHMGRWLHRCGASYVGIDGSRRMLKRAAERLKEQHKVRSRGGVAGGRTRPSPDFDLRHHDLESTVIRSADLEMLTRTQSPLLVTGVVILDHLTDPLPLLTALGLACSTRRHRTLFCFIVLNPEYFLEITDCDVGTFATKAEIHSAGQSVDVVFRSRRRWEVMLRDARLQTHAVVPLRFAAGEGPDRDDQKRSGIPPFLGIVCRPSGKHVGSPDVVDDALKSLVALGFETQSSILSNYRDQLEVAEFEPGEAILSRHNLGGDWFVIIEGRAELLIAGRIAQLFNAGELFGDLEAGCGYQSSYYAYNVNCSPSGPARVLRVPETVVNRIVVQHDAMRLFRQLRQRWAVIIWQFNARTRDAVPQEGRWLHLSASSRVVREVLAESERQRQLLAVDAAPDVERSGRGGGSCRPMRVEMTFENLKGHSLGRQNDQVNKVFRGLVEIGFIDTFQGPDLRRFHKTSLLWHWADLVRQSVAELDRKATHGRLANLWERAEIADGRQLHKIPRRGARSVGAESQFGRDFLAAARETYLENEHFRTWWIWLLETNRYMHSDCPYVFVTIQDLDALRTIAVGDDESIDSLVTAARHCRTLDAGGDRPLDARTICRLTPAGRVRVYLSAWREYRLELLRSAIGVRGLREFVR